MFGSRAEWREFAGETSVGLVVLITLAERVLVLGTSCFPYRRVYLA
jgi:hypothetical protein